MKLVTFLTVAMVPMAVVFLGFCWVYRDDLPYWFIVTMTILSWVAAVIFLFSDLSGGRK